MEELLRRARTQDEAAYRELFLQWYPKAWRVSRSLCRDRAMAEDALQEALIRFWRSLPRIREADRAEGYFLRIVLNETRRLMARRVETPEEGVEAAGEARSAEQVASGRESRRELLRAVEALPAKLSEALRLHYWGGFTVAEVAKLTYATPSSVKMRLKRGRAALKQELEREQSALEAMAHEWNQ